MSKNRAKILAFAILLSLSMGVYIPIFGSAFPVSDPYEPNDTSFTAASITEGTYTGLTFNATDLLDWYEISVPAGNFISIEVEITGADDGNFYYLEIEGVWNGEFDDDADGFYYYIAPDENDDTIGNILVFCEVATDILIEVTSYYATETNYTMTVDIYDPIGTPKFDYGIAEGDDLIYTLSNTLDFEASSAFYTEVQDYTESEVNESEYYSVVATNFSLEEFVGDMEDFISMSVDLKLDITDIYNFDMGEEYSFDWIEGDVRMGSEGVWELPSDYAVTKMEELKTMIEPHMNSTTYTDEAVPEIDDVIDHLETATTAEFNDLPLSGHTWFEDVNDFVGFSELDIANDSVFPTYPFDHYLPLGGFMEMGSSVFSAISSVSLCYPTEFNFAELYQFGLDVYDYADALAVELDEDLAVFDYTVDELIAIGGISAFHVNNQSIAISWALNGVDFSTIDTLINYTEGILENDFEEELADINIDYDNSAAVFSMALEYDENMVLISATQFVDLSIAIAGQGLPTGLDLGGEIITLSMEQSLVREGAVPPTIDQINEGELGEERNTSGGFDLSSIPGYSGLFVALISIASTFMLISRKKRTN
ncbi:MAG: hypothetical protein ACTSYI_09885 [Promethearchaeota archaeon]